MNIFVSYTTRNNEVTSNSLIEFSNKINSYGKVFIDLLDNDSINKQKRIINELEKSDLLILIKSLSSLNSEWVKFELETANKLKIPVIEFLIEDLDKLTEKSIGQMISIHHK
jgi:hypothetical protein